jgi:hypothetical protein
MENRIKEQQLALFADRTSTSWMRSNQIRLYFSSIAYCLMQALRRLGLAGTEMAKAPCQTIRLRLLKIGAQVRITVRKIWISLAVGHPGRQPVSTGLSQPHRRCCATMLRLSGIRTKAEVSLSESQFQAPQGAPRAILNEKASPATLPSTVGPRNAGRDRSQRVANTPTAPENKTPASAASLRSP